MKRIVKEADLGGAGSGATLTFEMPAASGFSIDASLDHEMKRVAAWESIEIAGRKTQEDLVPSGLYVLKIIVAFRSKDDKTATLAFAVSKASKTLKAQSVSFTGKKGDVALAVVFLSIG